MKNKKLKKLVRKLKRSDLNRVLKLIDGSGASTSEIQLAIAARVSAIKALKEFDKERWRQDKEWGGPEHDDEHSLDDWADFLAKQVGKLRALSDEWDGMQRSETESGISTLVKIGALAAAAYESALRLRR